MNVLSADQARQLFRYDPDTGKLFWRERSHAMFRFEKSAKAWNARYSGQEAFTSADGGGYRVGTIFRRQYKAHRVAWLIQTGEWPSSDIDHINGQPDDNRLANLRAVTRAENMRNRKSQRNNSSGVCGVHWSTANQKWRAQIMVDGKLKLLGDFTDLESAASARAAASALYGFTERHGV